MTTTNQANQPDKPGNALPSPYYLAALEVSAILAEQAKRAGGQVQKGGTE